MEVLELVNQIKETFDGLRESQESDIIKWALQRQIPKEVTRDIRGWVCPSCGCKRKERFSHCVACGQALKHVETEADQLERSKF